MVLSFLENLFFVLEIFTFANEESDGIIGGSTKIVEHSVKNISRNIKVQCSLNLVPEMSQKKQNITCCAIAVITVMPLVLF